MKPLLLILAALLARDEAALRDAFAKEIKAKDAKHRVEAVKKLAGAKEEKTIELLVHSLKDPELPVRKAAAETIEGAADGGGTAIKALGEILIDKKEDLDFRMACAKSLGKARYKSYAFPYFYTTISSIESTERQFHKFGADVTGIMDKFYGVHFPVDKNTAERWNEWWSDNKAQFQKDDEKLKEEWAKEKK
jgi:hypothetical protein